MIDNPAIDPKIGNIFVGLPGEKILESFLRNFLSLGVGMSGIACLFMLLIGGYYYVTSGGDKEAVQKATKTMTSGLIGLVLVFSIFAIMNVVELIFGIPLLKVTIPTITN